MTLESDEVIISFDMTSLYTNVPVKEGMQEATDRLYSGDLQALSVDKETKSKMKNTSLKI